METWKSFNEKNINSDSYAINEYFGGPLNHLMNPRVDKLIEYLENYKKSINEKEFVYEKDTRKVENMWNYIIHDVPLDIISQGNRQGRKVRGEGENLKQRIKRSIDNF